MAKVYADTKHILERIKERYSTGGPEILARIIKALENEVPDDWRFTESYSARFFLIDLESKVKILGITYRDCGHDLVNELQTIIHEDRVSDLAKDEGAEMKLLVQKYIDCLIDPEAQVIQQLRTAYPKHKGEISEDKSLFLKMATSTPHVVPLKIKKLGARPNAIVMKNGEIWVRQHLNWVEMIKHDTEYLLFERLAKDGVDKSTQRIYSYDSQGNISQVGASSISTEKLITKLDKQFMNGNYRTETFWTLPTYVDLRIMDLGFRQRKPEETYEGPLRRNEMMELYYLRKIVSQTQRQFVKEIPAEPDEPFL